MASFNYPGLVQDVTSVAAELSSREYPLEQEKLPAISRAPVIGVGKLLRDFARYGDSFCRQLNEEWQRLRPQTEIENLPGCRLAVNVRDSVKQVIRVFAADRSDPAFAEQAAESVVFPGPVRTNVIQPSKDVVRCIRFLWSVRGGWRQIPLLAQSVKDALKDALFDHDVALSREIGRSPEAFLGSERKRNPLFKAARIRIDLMPPAVSTEPSAVSTEPSAVSTEPAAVPVEPQAMPAGTPEAPVAAAPAAAVPAAIARPRPRVPAMSVEQRKQKLLADYTTLLAKFDAIPNECAQAIMQTQLDKKMTARLEQWISCHKKNYSQTLDEDAMKLRCLSRELQRLGAEAMSIDEIDVKSAELQARIDNYRAEQATIAA